MNNSKTLTIITMLLVYAQGESLFAQTDRYFGQNAINLQSGFGLKASFEFGFGQGDPGRLPYPNKTTFSISGSAGIGSNFLTPNLYQSVNLEMLFFRGGFGSRRPGDPKAKPYSLDVVFAFTLTGGSVNGFQASEQDALTRLLRPLYFFSNFSNPTLQNPFDYSLSLGTNWIVSSDNHRTRQRVGFLNLNFNQIQVSYYNDGGFFMHELNLGDRKDRYYTGGLLVSYLGNATQQINRIEVAFHKFTGYSKDAFEASNELDLAFVNYSDPSQVYYNKSMYTINVSDMTAGWTAFMKSYNWSAMDLQHGIHKSLFNSYHISPYNSFVTLGGQYFYGGTQINTR
jgi:hypothetical protein